MFESTWTEIIKSFGFYDEYYNYIKEEYKKYFETTGLRSISSFCKNHPYIRRDVLMQLDIDKLKIDCDIQKYRYTNNDYKNNFLEIKDKLGHIPLYNEFILYSKITIESYAFKYNLKGVVYDEVVKMFSTKTEYIEYKKMANINQFEYLLLDKISKILKTDYIPQTNFDWLVNNEGYSLSIDGYFEDYNLMVEADGQQHRVPMGYFGGEDKLKKQIENDTIKDKLVKDNGFKMLRIYIESEWHNEEYLIDRLKELNIKPPNQHIA